LDRLGVAHPDVLVDYFYGRPTIENALYILRNLPKQISEIVVHIGNSTRQSDFPNGLDTGYFDDRERELAVLTSVYLREYARLLNVSFIRFSDLARVRSSP
jgi:hypothetical protein